MKTGSFFNHRLAQSVRQQRTFRVSDMLGHVVHTHQRPDPDVFFDARLVVEQHPPHQVARALRGMGNFYVSRAIAYLQKGNLTEASRAKALAEALTHHAKSPIAPGLDRKFQQSYQGLPAREQQTFTHSFQKFLKRLQTEKL